jgi:hypothetical protein
MRIERGGSISTPMTNSPPASLRASSVWGVASVPSPKSGRGSRGAAAAAGSDSLLAGPLPDASSAAFSGLGAVVGMAPPSSAMASMAAPAWRGCVPAWCRSSRPRSGPRPRASAAPSPRSTPPRPNRRTGPPTRRGSPALGTMDLATVALGGPVLTRASKQTSGPAPQLTPTASTPALVRAARPQPREWCRRCPPVPRRTSSGRRPAGRRPDASSRAEEQRSPLGRKSRR